MVCRAPSSQASAAVLSTNVASDKEALQAQMPFSRVVTGDEVSRKSPSCWPLTASEAAVQQTTPVVNQ